MTKIISRVFPTKAKAQDAVFDLIDRQRFSPHIVQYHDDAAGLADLLQAEHVAADTAKAYQDKVASGGAVVLVKAGYRPLSVAQKARDTLAFYGPTDIGGMTQEVQIESRPEYGRSTLPHHPKMLTRSRSQFNTNYHMANWPLELISRRKPWNPSPFFDRHQRFADFPIGLLSGRKPFTGSVFRPHARMANFPIPLISRRKPITASIFPRHARMANFPINLISRRKPKDRTVIGRHTRMARWPFPLLINGTPGMNSLVPGAPRMANFPIPLTNDRKPFAGSIFPRHARMANMFLPLTNRRKPYSKMIFDPHSRMANIILPLVIRTGQARSPQGGNSFSKWLRMPTIISR